MFASMNPEKLAEIEALNELNQGVIAEAHNCAVFLSQISDMIGKVGPVSFDMEIKKDCVSAKPVNEPDMLITGNISDKILNVPIGAECTPITLDAIKEKLVEIHQRPRGRVKAMHGAGKIVFIPEKDDPYLQCHVELVSIVSRLIGKDGPLWFHHGIVQNSNQDVKLDAVRRARQFPVPVPGPGVGYDEVDLEGELLRVPVGQKGKKVGIENFVTAFFEVSTNSTLEAFRKSGRAFFHEGFSLNDDEDALIMDWGS